MSYTTGFPLSCSRLQCQLVLEAPSLGVPVPWPGASPSVVLGHPRDAQPCTAALMDGENDHSLSIARASVQPAAGRFPEDRGSLELQTKLPPAPSLPSQEPAEGNGLLWVVCRSLPSGWVPGAITRCLFQTHKSKRSEQGDPAQPISHGTSNKTTDVKTLLQ